MDWKPLKQKVPSTAGASAMADLICGRSLISLTLTLQSHVISLLFVAAFFDHCAGSSSFPFVRNASSSPSSSEYDFIVVGGGTAGCPLAASLSQRFKVLLLERGGLSDPILSNENNIFAQFLDSNTTTSPVQNFASEEGVLNQRARVLGGGSSIGFGYYSRASSTYIKRAGWDKQLVQKSYEWVEKAIVSFPSELLEWQATVRAGLLQARVLPDNGVTLDERFGTKTYGTIFDGMGNRRSAAKLLGYAESANIDVLLFATVQQILFQPGDGAPKASGVEYLDEDGGMHRATLSRGGEVILSAGALGSPQLLLLSGIGPAKKLRSLNIDPVLDLPNVGRGMADNPSIVVVLPFRRQVAFSTVQVVGKTAFGSYIEAVSGGDSNFISGVAGILSILPPHQRIDPIVVKSVYANFSRLQPQIFDDLFNRIGILHMKVSGPASKGRLQLGSTNVTDNPFVRFNYFTNEQDLQQCVKAMKVVGEVARSGAVRNLSYASGDEIPEELRPGLKLVGNVVPGNTEDEAAMEKFCKETVITIWHYHGGCQVGKVVDSDYRVLGVKGLRVVDGSTFHATPGAGPQATVMMLGRYVGVQILRQKAT